MTVTEDLVREELKKVIDPELFVNIVDLGLIYEVTINEAAVADGPESEQDAAPADSGEGSAENVPADGPRVDISIEMTMTSPACPAGPQLIANARQVVGRLEGVNDVEVKIVMDPPWTPDRMTDDARDQLGIF